LYNSAALFQTAELFFCRIPAKQSSAKNHANDYYRKENCYSSGDEEIASFCK
jgi:hypothetical protein